MSHEFTTERKPMDAALRSYLDALPPAPVSPAASDEETTRVRRAVIEQARETRGSIPGLPNGVEAQDVSMSTPTAEAPAPDLTGRLYTPQGAESLLPLLVYAHGGGWVVGSIETHDAFCRLLSEAADIIILSVAYRLAPEHRFPAGLEDLLAAFQWVEANAGSFGGDAKRLLLGGDSAGANLAAVTANRICATGEAARPAGLLLLYPVTDHPSAGHASYKENGAECGLDGSLMKWFWNQYAPDTPPDDPGISPLGLHALPDLPPTLVATAEYDPLRDEGIAYAEKLKGAGVAVTHLHAADMHHNFPVHPGTVARFPQSLTALQDFAGWVKNLVRLINS
jgi:acetyl esterase